MVKFVLDADALIKLAKAGLLTKFAEHNKCFVPEQVYKEVLRGKEKMYEDAFITEDAVNKKLIKVLPTKTEQIMEGLGKGECAALILFKEVNADAIVSDDKKFLSVLEQKETPFITTTDAIAFIKIKGHITKEEAIMALTAIRMLVTEENYQQAKETIGGK